MLAGVEPFEPGREEISGFEPVDQEGGCAGLEPVGAELAQPQQQKNIKGIVNGLCAPGVAIVPALHLGAVQRPTGLGGSGKFRREDAVQVRLGIAADTAEGWVQR